MASTFVVTGQRPSSRITASNQIEKTIEVSFRTVPSNLAGSVEIGQSQYNPDTVKALIEPLAANLEAVNNL